jgi:hypothetical protein
VNEHICMSDSPSVTHRSLRDLIIGRPRSGHLLVLILVVYLAISFSVHLRFCLSTAALALGLNQSVVEHVPTYYLNQMFYVSPILDSAWKSLCHIPFFAARKVNAFAFTYYCFYTLGILIFLTINFRNCLHLTGDRLATLVSMLYLVALFPLFWYDNFFHPSDPYGCIFAALITSCLIDDRYDWRYYLPLLVSGFVWEKHAFVPLIVFLADCLSHVPWKEKLSRLVFGAICAGFGQVLVRVLVPGHRVWAGDPFIQNMHGIPRYVILMAVLFGVQIWASCKGDARIPKILRLMSLQWIIWPILYLAAGGVLAEMRGMMIMVPLSWPLLAVVWSKMHQQLDLI